jgi:hypothetical protein
VRGRQLRILHLPAKGLLQSGVKLLKITEPLPDTPLEDLLLLHLSARQAELTDDFIFDELRGGEVVDARAADDRQKRRLVLFRAREKTSLSGLASPEGVRREMGTGGRGGGGKQTSVGGTRRHS